jgi:glycosyltransferase involved in cell wall biosynthesis
MHEYFLACPNGGFFHYGEGTVCTRKAMSLSCMSTNCDQRRYVHKLFRLARQATADLRGRLPRDLRNVICISELQKSVMVPYLPRDAQLHSVGNPISVEQAPRVTAEDNEAFVFVGRLEPVKGATDFAAAAAKADLPAVFVGDGVQADEVRALNPNAHLTGWVTPAQVMEQIRTARCLVFPSHWYECQPLVPYEALAQGIPVISYDCSAAREAIDPQATGEIVPFDDRAAAFPQALSRYKDDAYVQARSKAAYDRYWSEPLTLDRHVNALLEVYDKVA